MELNYIPSSPFSLMSAVNGKKIRNFLADKLTSLAINNYLQTKGIEDALVTYQSSLILEFLYGEIKEHLQELVVLRINKKNTPSLISELLFKRLSQQSIVNLQEKFGLSAELMERIFSFPKDMNKTAWLKVENSIKSYLIEQIRLTKVNIFLT